MSRHVASPIPTSCRREAREAGISEGNASRTPSAKQIACSRGLRANRFVICEALVAINQPRVPGPAGPTGQSQRYLGRRCEAEGCDTGRGVKLQCPG